MKGSRRALVVAYLLLIALQPTWHALLPAPYGFGNAWLGALLALLSLAKLHDRQLLNLSYRYRRDILKQTDVSFLWPLTQTWHVIGRWNYSLDDDQTLEALAGLPGRSSTCA